MNIPFVCKLRVQPVAQLESFTLSRSYRKHAAYSVGSHGWKLGGEFPALVLGRVPYDSIRSADAENGAIVWSEVRVGSVVEKYLVWRGVGDWLL
jgi:hypothetical protein